MNISRWLKDLREKMVADPLPPEKVAAGWALGMFVGCSIPFGMQLVISVPLAAMMRVSKIGASVGTLITNPVTIFFIYPAQTYAVNHLLFGGSLKFSRLMEVEWTWEAVKSLGAEAMASFFLGGMFLAAILTPITYFCVKKFVAHRRNAIALRRAENRG
jgi:uncharacterized protein (DUF2062 family)